MVHLETSSRSLCAMARTAAASLALVALSAASAMAHDDDAPQPMDAHSKAIQMWTWSIAGIVVVLAVGFYWFRRWQTTHSGNVVHGYERDDK